jgi:hypothetical protein
MLATGYFIGPYPNAIDYFGDVSMYIVDAPG